MPEISSTMYPIIIAGAVAILVLLLLLVVARRRRARRDRSAEEHDTAFPGAEDDSLGVELIEDDDEAPGSDDEARGQAGRDDRVADGTVTSPAATTGSRGEAGETGTSPTEAAGSHGAERRSGSLVAWGPDETVPEKLRAGAEAPAGTDRAPSHESAAETPAPDAGSHIPAESPRAESPSGREPEAGSHSGLETPPAESLLPAESGFPPAFGAEHQEAESAGPEGQPFERDGRWWFRRDGELLVYDDATSEWKAAPHTGSPPLEARSPVSAADVDKAAHGEALRETSTIVTIEREAHGSPEGTLRPRSEGATFWKCRTCGATNGSAAESCRMCFAARP